MTPTARRVAFCFAAGLAAATALPASAQPVREPASLLLDLSAEALIDAASAKALVREHVPARVWKLYPETKWTFLSQVQGGLTSAGICVVTARVVMLPRTGTVRAVLWRPSHAASAFDARPGATPEQCKALAREKLTEATTSVVSALVKS